MITDSQFQMKIFTHLDIEPVFPECDECDDDSELQLRFSRKRSHAVHCRSVMTHLTMSLSKPSIEKNHMLYIAYYQNSSVRTPIVT